MRGTDSVRAIKFQDSEGADIFKIESTNKKASEPDQPFDLDEDERIVGIWGILNF